MQSIGRTRSAFPLICLEPVCRHPRHRPRHRRSGQIARKQFAERPWRLTVPTFEISAPTPGLRTQSKEALADVRSEVEEIAEEAERSWAFPSALWPRIRDRRR